MSEFIEIKASLSIFVPRAANSPLLFHLKQGESIFGTDASLCNNILDLEEIDKIQMKISIYEYGECSIESLSDQYDNFKEYEVIPGHKHLLKMRKNKEYDVFNGMVFYISKYRALFNIEFKENQEKKKNYFFSSTLFVPDRELFEEDSQKIKNKISENNQKFDFIPTQNLEFQEQIEDNKGIERSKEIRKIFQQAVEKIKKNCKLRNITTPHLEETDISDDMLSKFVDLFDSVKEEIHSKSKCSQMSLLSNSNSKGFSTSESPNMKEISTLKFKECSLGNEKEGEGRIMLEKINEQLVDEQIVHKNLEIFIENPAIKNSEIPNYDNNNKNENNEEQKTTNIFQNSKNLSNFPNEKSWLQPSLINNPENLSNENHSTKTLFQNPNLIQNLDIIIEKPVLQSCSSQQQIENLPNLLQNKKSTSDIPLEKSSLQSSELYSFQNQNHPLNTLNTGSSNNNGLKPPMTHNNGNIHFLEPPCTQNKLQPNENLLSPKNSILAPTVRESQIASGLLAPTVRESQMGENVLAATVRESQALLAPTIRESQILAATIRESQIPDSMKKEKFQMTATVMQSEAFPIKTEEKLGKFIRDSKRNVKKRKLELPELIKFEKKRNLEKKIKEEQFQSLKLFIKDTIDDLDDLFEKDSITKEKAERNLNEDQNAQEFSIGEIRGISLQNDIKESIEDHNKKSLEDKRNKKEIQKKKPLKQTLKRNIVFEEHKTSDPAVEPQNGEIKKPKLYLTQKTMCFTSNDSLNNSSKKAHKKIKKNFIEEDEDKNQEESASSDGENLYQFPVKKTIEDYFHKEVTKKEENKKNDENKNEENKKDDNRKEEKKEDSGTEVLDSDIDNKDNKLEKNTMEEEQKHDHVNTQESKNKESQKKTCQGKKKLGNIKLNKTLTQIFSSPKNNQLNAVLSVTFGGCKPTKKEIDGLRDLKVEIVEDPLIQKSDVMIVNKLKKEAYLLIAINKGIDVISKKWVDDTLAAKSIQLMDAYHFKDTEFEKENNIFLDQMILKTKLQGGLLNDYKVWINSTKKDFKRVIESAGGTMLDKMPEKNEEKTLIIVDETKKRLVIDLAEKNIQFYFTDYFIDACLKQELVL